MKYDDSKEDSVSSFELTKKVSEKSLKLPKETNYVYVVPFSFHGGNSLYPDENSST